MENNIVEKIRKYVESVFSLPEAKYKESYENHFVPVVHFVRELSKKLNVDDNEKEIVEIAAWLHDIGSIIHGRENHHITGAEIAEKKLRELNYPEEKIKVVKKCILNHRGSCEDVNNRELLIEGILVDADSMSAFENIDGLFQAAFLWENLNQQQARKSVKEKLIRKYNQLSETSKELIKPKYEAAMILLGEKNGV
jgi:uncharacterized protein